MFSESNSKKRTSQRIKRKQKQIKDELISGTCLTEELNYIFFQANISILTIYIFHLIALIIIASNLSKCIGDFVEGISFWKEKKK